MTTAEAIEENCACQIDRPRRWWEEPAAKTDQITYHKSYLHECLLKKLDDHQAYI